MKASDESFFAAVIVDDETGSIETLCTMLERYCPQVKVLKTFEYADEAIRELPALRPDLLFLDVEMPDINGFGLLNVLKDKLKAEVIFTTAYPQYVERSIGYAALDYLVKPIQANQLAEAIVKFSARHGVERDHGTRFRVLLENQEKPPEEQLMVLEDFESKIYFTQPEEQELFFREFESKIHFIRQGKAGLFTAEQFSHSNLKVNDDNLFLPDREKLNVVRLDQIVRLLAVGSYTIIYCADGSQFIPARNLGLFEPLLTGDGMPFFRTHESHIINRKYIKNYTLKEPFEIEIERTKDKIPLARRRKKAFTEWIGG
jgi:DNA-binding LytR/AlgR family response regulator